MVFYWLPWFMLALAGVTGRSAGLRHAWAPVVATGIGALMMASYGTVTLRYRFDLWPFLMALAMLSLPRVLLRLNAEPNSEAVVQKILPVALLVSLIVMPAVMYLYSFRFAEYSGYIPCGPTKPAPRWYRPRKGLGPDAVERLCGL
jgi:hypothetical protein